MIRLLSSNSLHASVSASVNRAFADLVFVQFQVKEG